MQQALQSFDEISPMYLGGNNGISLSINVSHNFANSSHYDSLDYGPSIVIWVMDDEANQCCDQYLVFNNVVETKNNEEGKRGLLIKISDGMIMSFQGDTLCHGTTIRRDSITGKVCPDGNIYGIHFGLSMPSLTSFRRIRIDQYIREMNQIPKMVIRKRVTNDDGEDDMKYASRKRTANDDIIKNISSTVAIEDDFETTKEMEQEYYADISLEIQKVTPILVDRDKQSKMLKQFSIENMNNSFQIG